MNITTRISRGLLVMPALLALGCSISSGHLKYNSADESSPFFHMLTFNERGASIDPTGNILCSNQPQASPVDNGLLDLCYGRYTALARFRPLSDQQYDRYLTKLFEARQRYYHRSGNPKVLIFVHGGLNTLTESIERALLLHWIIENDPHHSYFPIFINWESSFTASYVDYLFNVRQGKDLSNSWYPYDILSRWVLVPYLVSEGVVRAIARAPIAWWNQTVTDVSAIPIVATSEEDELRKLRPVLEANYRVSHGKACPNHGSSDRNGDCREWLERLISFAQWVVTEPVKLATAPFIDAFGTNAWDSMQRSIHLLFHSERDFCVGDTCEGIAKNHQTDAARSQGLGGLSEFLRRLQEHVESGNTEWKITVVGHSMGTIVLNESLRRFREIPYENIVYMAGASSIRDYEDSVYPYLKRQQRKQKESRMYHLLLHEEAEVRDRWDTYTKVVDLPPRGSLLVWIDTFFTKPQTRLDRTVGRWTNLSVALHNMGPSLTDAISVKVFDVGESIRCTAPQKHGDFDEFPFWNPNFWTVNPRDPVPLRRTEGCMP